MKQNHTGTGGAEVSGMSGLAEELAGASGRTISRRAVGLGAAWSVPVILVAVAAPAAAASQDLSTALTGALVALRDPSGKFGNKHIEFTLTLTNASAGATTVEVLSVSSDGGPGITHGLPTTVVVPAGGSQVVTFSFDISGNAGKATYTASYRVSGVVKTATATI
jgi:hypothetical protein